MSVFRISIFSIIFCLLGVMPLSAENYQIVDISELLQGQLDTEGSYIDYVANDRGDIAILVDSALYFYSTTEGLRKIEDLPLGEDMKLENLEALSNKGVLIGTIEDSSQRWFWGEFVPFVYYPDKGLILLNKEVLAGLEVESLSVEDVNDHGVVVGDAVYLEPEDYKDTIFTYDPEKGFTLLEGSEDMEAYKINNDGQILMSKDSAYYLYDPDAGYLLLDVHGGGDEFLNNGGIAAIEYGGGVTVYFRNENNEIQRFYIPEVDLEGMNDKGLLVLEDEDENVYTWSLNKKKLMEIPYIWENGEEDRLAAEDVNNEGQVVGYAVVDDRSILYLWDQANGTQDLSSVFDIQGLHLGMDLNDRGEILLYDGYRLLLLVPETS